MKFKIENLGAIDDAEFELADLTIICGENNTGKTYVTYFVFCFLSTLKQFFDIDIYHDLLALRKTGVARINLQKGIAEKWPSICEESKNRFIKAFPEMMASKSELLKNFTVQVDISLGAEWERRGFQSELRSAEGTLLITMSKPENSVELTLAALKPTESANNLSLMALEEFIKDRLFYLMLSDVIPNVFIASTERTGATTFRKQLNLATSKFQELLVQAHKEGAKSMTPDRVWQTMYGQQDYALPVRSNVQFLNQLPDANAEDGELFRESPFLLKQFESIVGGTYATNKEGITNFQPVGTKLKLGLGEVSSSVRSLLIVWYWLKHLAKKGEMLMLDEPELNLHPANQRRLARFIAALVNQGVKVFLTTHSDYIIKELNTLIMLSQPSGKIEKIIENLTDYSVNDKLNPNKVALYMVRDENRLRSNGKRKTKTKTLVRAEISPTLGIEAKSFDETIDDMNKVQEAIYYGLH